jgi:isoquinoline 1-oxidoreductase
MSEQQLIDPAIELEWYVLPGDSTFSPEVSRRDFLRVVGGGLVVALFLYDLPAQAQRGGGQPVPEEVGGWLHVDEKGAVTVYTGKVEIGQNIRTSLTQVVAEELHTPAERIRLVMADTQLVPFDMGTFGSQTTPQMATRLRRVAAAAREALLDLAAEQGKVERAELVVRDGQVVHPKTEKTFAFGELTKGKKLMKAIGQGAATTPPEKWTVAGKPLAKVDGRAIVTGSHRYASDIHRPGMLFGKVLRPPTFKSELISVQTGDAEAMKGVTVVHDKKSGFVGVTAPTQRDAEQALAAIKAEWKSPPELAGDDLFKHLKERPAGGGGRGGRGGGGGGFGGRGGGTQGSVADGLKEADQKVEATYTVAYIAHTPLEPRAAVAEWDGDKLTVWTGTQRPFGVRGELVSAFGLPAERVRVIVPDMGSGYGGKHSGESAIEAARLAKAAGKPVKLVWTREEEFTWAYFRPAGVIEVKAGAGKDGTLMAWEFHNYNSGGSALQTPYVVPNLRQEFHSSDAPLKQGPYRGLAATANHFARESHMDDLAHALKLDPLDFRLKNLKDARLRAVLEAAATRFGWGKAKADAGRGFGIAGGTEKGSYVATCAEVAAEVKTGRVQVVRLVTAFECGAVLNPEHLKNQVEGAAIMGLGGALYEAIRFDNGKVLNPRFSEYRVPRFPDTPLMETVLLDRKDLPSAGAGETPIVTVAPAVGNAIFAASGIRLRSMPMIPNGLKAPAKEG